MAIEGKTYTLGDAEGNTEQYYAKTKELTEHLLDSFPDEARLLSLIQKAGKRSLLESLIGRESDSAAISTIRKTLKDSLSSYTGKVARHLRELPVSKRGDETLVTKEEQYHLFMIEIELVNRIHRESFKRSEHKVALIAHCLRDFRPQCRSVPGDIEAVCSQCTQDCHINLGSLLLERYGIRPYISMEIDQEKLFKRLKRRHPSVGALGIACIPELAMGMRLCMRLNIPPVGIPLDANRCARWMSHAQETSFSLMELERLLQ